MSRSRSRRAGLVFGLVFSVCCWVLVAALSSEARAAVGQSPADARPLSRPPQPVAGAEVASMRTATSNTYRSANGAYLTKISASPVNHRVADRWEPIESTLQRTAAGDLVPRSAATPVQLPGDAGGVVKVGDGDSWVSTQLMSASGAAVVKDDTATYVEALAGVTVGLEARSAGVQGDAGSRVSLGAVDVSVPPRAGRRPAHQDRRPSGLGAGRRRPAAVL